jgi:hypothetical protein
MTVGAPEGPSQGNIFMHQKRKEFQSLFFRKTGRLRCDMANLPTTSTL